MNITKKHIPGVVKNSYIGGKPTTIVLHETANQMSTIDNESDFVNRNWQNAFFHYLVTDDAIYEKADPRYLAWGAGPQINPYAIHIELVRNNGNNFNKAYGNYIWLARKLAKDYNIPIILNKHRNGIVTHHWVSMNLGGTDHSDPDAWLAQNGVSLSKLENDLKKGGVEMAKASKDDVNYLYRGLLGYMPTEAEAKPYVGMEFEKAAHDIMRWTFNNARDYERYKKKAEADLNKAKKDLTDKSAEASRLEKEVASLKSQLNDRPSNGSGGGVDQQMKEDVSWIRSLLGKVFK